MDAIRNYLLQILSAAIICSVITHWIPIKGSCGQIIKMLAGIFMTVTMLSPLIHINIQDADGYFGYFHDDAQAAVSNGLLLAKESTAAIIKEQTEAYILDKAAFWDMEISVEVTLNESDPPVPIAVDIHGNVSPYAKRQLTQWLEQEIGIEEGNQRWK